MAKVYGFVRQLPEFRQAKSRGEQEERERVLRLIRSRRSLAASGVRRLEREIEAGDEAAGDAPDKAPDEAGDAVRETAAEPRGEARAEARAEARGAGKALEELEKAVRYGWQR